MNFGDEKILSSNDTTHDKVDVENNDLAVRNHKKKFLTPLFLTMTMLFLASSIYLFIQFYTVSNKYEKLKMDYLNKMGDVAQVHVVKYTNSQLEKELQALKKENQILRENSDITNGIFFEVQLGAFKDFDLDKYLENLSAIRQEKHDDRNKLLLGRFTSFEQALLFENDMKRLGFDEAFIVGRVDGSLVSFQEALEILKSKATN